MVLPANSLTDANTFNYKNTIIYGDCIPIMKSIPSDYAALTLTDIPYDVVSRGSNGLRVLDKKNADVITFNLEDFIDEVVRITKGSIYIFCSTEQVSDLRKSLVERKLSTRLCIWEKTNPSPMNGQHIWLSGVEVCVYGKKAGATFNEHCKNTVWRFPSGRSKIHPTEKSLKLFEYLVTASSNPGDLVFDPCLGGGTTAVAALKNGRDYLGIELDEEFYMAARKRIGEENGK
jgi:site-specific DNA-methyltransferase (adenine-specific)